MEIKLSPPRFSPRLGVLAVQSYLPILAVCAGFWLAVQCYLVPITRGGDRNAYLLGGKMLADGHFTGIMPPDPYANYGQHWVVTTPGRLNLKFPLGLPAIYAIIDVIGGRANWPAGAHQLSPIMATLAIFGTFCLLRPIVGALYALMGAILIAVSPVTFFFADMPNSHATALCVAVWGMTMLLAWWRNGGAWRAALAGLILGFNFAVRYTEGLLLIPLLTVVCFNWRSRQRESIRLLLGWLVLVIGQVTYNLIVLRHFTGYGLTHESTAFSINNFFENWSTMLSDLYNGGLFFVLPLAVLGAILIAGSDWRLALVIWGWFLPPILLYTSYYWTPDEAGPAGVHYLRFILTVVPALVLCAMWLPHALRGNAALLATGVIVAAAAVGELGLSTSAAADMQWTNLTAMVLEKHVARDVPAGSLIFGQGGDLIMLQVAGDWRLYSSDLFTSKYLQTFAQFTRDNPQGLQPRRAKELLARLGGKSDAELAAVQNQLIESASAQRRRVFLLLPREACEQFCARFHLHGEPIDRWEVDGRWRGQPMVDMQLDEIKMNAQTQRMQR